MSEGAVSTLNPQPSIPSPGFERLDTLVRVTTIQSWVYLGLLFGVGIAAMAFAILYKVPTKVAGEGILLTEQDTIVQVRAQGTGRLLSLNVKIGEKVKRDQPIGEISQEELRDTILQAESKLVNMLEEDRDLTICEQRERETLENAMAKVRHATGQEQLSSGDKLKIAAHLVESADELRRKFYMSDQELLEAREKKYSIRNDINKGDTRLAELELDAAKAENTRRRAKLERQLKIKDVERKLDLDRDKMLRTSKVVSRASGVVTQVFVARDELVKEGAPVVLLHSPKSEHEIDDAGKEYDSIVFVPAGEGKKINEDDDVEVSPTTVKREEHGFIKGKVVAVSELPATKLAMESALQHPELVANFLKRHADSVLLRVHVKLEPAKADDVKRARASGYTEVNHYHWSSSSGLSRPLKTGTMCQAAIVVEKRPLIGLVLPWTKRMMGGTEPGMKID